jgi:hypothetical protein
LIVYHADQLPEKIQTAFKKRRKLTGQFVLSFKTLFKPNSTIPTLWFTLLSDGIIFLNTHKTRGVYKEITNAEINCVRFRVVSAEESMIDIVSANILEEDFSFTLSRKIDLTILKTSFEKTNLSIVS